MKMTIIASTMLLLVATGCSSLSYRLASNTIEVRPGIYPATRLDVKCSDNAKRGGGWMMGNPSYLMAALFYLDVPISLVTDTIGLPWDIARGKRFQVWDKFLAGDTEGITSDMLRATYTAYGDTIAYHKLHYHENISVAQLKTLAIADIQPAEIADHPLITPEIAAIVSSNHASDRLIILKLNSNRGLQNSTQQPPAPRTRSPERRNEP